jgi:hypothetical protein
MTTQCRECHVYQHGASDRDASDGQTLSALGTPRPDDCLATAGFHAHPKSVGALAAGNRRLISSFHDSIPTLGKKPFITAHSALDCQFGCVNR